MPSKELPPPDIERDEDGLPVLAQPNMLEGDVARVLMEELSRSSLDEAPYIAGEVTGKWSVTLDAEFDLVLMARRLIRIYGLDLDRQSSEMT